MIIALDVSTSTVGIAVFNEDGDLIEVTHISPPNLKKEFDRWSEMYYKIDAISTFLLSFIQDKQISKIIIEEPLKNSANPNVASKLNFFGGMLYQKLRDIGLSQQIEYININESRHYGIPEILGDNGKMYSKIPKVIEGVKISEYRKLITLYFISKKFPQVFWPLSNNLTIDKKNFDRADAITLGLSYFTKNNIIENKIVEENKLVEFLTGYLRYLNFCKDQIEKNPAFIKTEKVEIKKAYLENDFPITKYLNTSL